MISITPRRSEARPVPTVSKPGELARSKSLENLRTPGLSPLRSALEKELKAPWSVDPFFQLEMVSLAMYARCPC